MIGDTCDRIEVTNDPKLLNRSDLVIGDAFD